jgi:hypothetical protein
MDKLSDNNHIDSKKVKYFMVFYYKKNILLKRKKI